MCSPYRAQRFSHSDSLRQPVNVPVDNGNLGHLAGGAALSQRPHIPDNALLLRLTGYLVVDVRETIGPGIDAAIREEHPIRVHGVHGDKVLGGAGALKVVRFPVAGL